MKKVIYIKCEDSPSYDQTVHEIVVTRETETDWFGSPVNNPDCPELQWPKFAWKEVRP